MFLLFAVYIQKKQSKGTKRKTRQAKALEARRAPRTFLELLHEVSDYNYTHNRSYT